MGTPGGGLRQRNGCMPKTKEAEVARMCGQSSAHDAARACVRVEELALSFFRLQLGCVPPINDHALVGAIIRVQEEAPSGADVWHPPAAHSAEEEFGHSPAGSQSLRSASSGDAPSLARPKTQCTAGRWKQHPARQPSANRLPDSRLGPAVRKRGVAVHGSPSARSRGSG